MRRSRDACVALSFVVSLAACSDGGPASCQLTCSATGGFSARASCGTGEISERACSYDNFGRPTKWIVYYERTTIVCSGFSYDSLGQLSRVECREKGGASCSLPADASGTIAGADFTEDCANTPVPPALFDLAGSGTDNVWAVGDNQTIMVFDGSVWSTFDTGNGSHLRAAWANSPTDVWMVGWNATLLHLGPDHRTLGYAGVDGLNPVILGGVWGSGSTDAWAVGESGTMVHWSGEPFPGGGDWTLVPLNTMSDLRSVWGSGPNDVWTVGAGATALHWNGTAWAAAGLGNPIEPRDGWSAGPGEAWVVGDGGRILHFTGGVWAPSNSGATENLNAVSGTSSDNVWAVGSEGVILHWNGLSWSRVPSGTVENLASVWSAATNDAWAVGTHRLMLRWNGSVWSNVPLPP